MCVAAFILSVATVTAQTLPEGVVGAFRSGKAEHLRSCLEEKVEFIVDNTTQAQEKGRVIAEMQRFFQDKNVRDFQVNHEGVRQESGFLIGTLNTVKGSFRVQCFLKKKENKFLIHQIRIDGTSE